MAELQELKGESVFLRKIKQSDLDDRFRIGSPKEYIYMCGGNRDDNIEFPSYEHWKGWYEFHQNEKYAWIIEFQGKCIGGSRLHNISEADHCGTYAIGIFDISKLSKGLGTEVTRLILGYGFNVLKLHRIDLKVLEYNIRAIRCYEKCGFKVDGILRENALIEGQYFSDIVMSILEKEYRALYK